MSNHRRQFFRNRRICNGRWIYTSEDQKVLEPKCEECGNYIPGLTSAYLDGKDCMKENEND